MTTNRWKVQKNVDDFFSPDGTEWSAHEQGKWNECRAFSAHAEALAYADQQARTRKYVLPRLDPKRPVHKAPVKTQGADNMWVKPHHDGVHIQHHFPPRPQGAKSINTKGLYVPRHHLRPLALALLAHAERLEK